MCVFSAAASVPETFSVPTGAAVPLSVFAALSPLFPQPEKRTGRHIRITTADKEPFVISSYSYRPILQKRLRLLLEINSLLFSEPTFDYSHPQFCQHISHTHFSAAARETNICSPQHFQSGNEILPEMKVYIFIIILPFLPYFFYIIGRKQIIFDYNSKSPKFDSQEFFEIPAPFGALKSSFLSAPPYLIPFILFATFTPPFLKMGMKKDIYFS
ncbi:hypothetical protein [Moryella indoligenes]|uniref:hypothetical protein n=1 Tax=Moryella indoligenes TaxID=371674 RepID=UPI0027D7AB59|nr:hypothetical protein [Moryella indoligenes]